MSILQHVGIDYEALVMACKFYKHYGYHQIETPWLVSEASALATSPDGTRGCAFVTDAGEYLVCSAEQGFVEMVTNHQLMVNTKYYSISPCFRNEPLDATHSRTFLKLELFSMFNPDKKKDASIRCVEFLEDARELLSSRFSIPTQITPTSIGFDIVDSRRGLELGSYGYRQIGQFHCAYGTGLALPRVSIAGDMGWDITNEL